MPAIDSAGRRRDDGKQRARPAKTAEMPDVSGAGLLVDDADDEKERGLEDGVRQQ